MAPRSYHLGKRAESTAETRQRILRAAAQVFQERGVAAASIAEVARAADVSRGTVVNHFGSSDALLSAVLDEVIQELELPSTRLLEGATDHADRVRRFVDGLCRFYERSSPWWQTFGQGFEDHPVYKEKEATFWASVHTLALEALGPAMSNRVVGTSVWMLLHPWAYGQLRWTSLTLDEAIDVLTDLVLHVLPTREEVSPG